MCSAKAREESKKEEDKKQEDAKNKSERTWIPITVVKRFSSLMAEQQTYRASSDWGKKMKVSRKNEPKHTHVHMGKLN